ncbi:MAG: Holliday junction resolvase RuvX [Actinomycetota bacterium]
MTPGQAHAGVRLAVDVGTVRVGVAACDPAGVLAFPVGTFTRDVNGADQDRIAAEVTERNAVEVLVGLPRSLSGADGPAARAAREYADRLAELLAVPVRLIDERLSTVQAHRALHHSGVPGRRHRGVVDQVAAVVLLQNALDTERMGDGPAGNRQ